MMATRIEKHASEWSKYLLVAALSSLVTSWALETPLLHRKEAKLQVVEQKVLPAMAGQIAQTKTQLAQVTCDKEKFLDTAVQAIEADKNPRLDAPDWRDLLGCPNVRPGKPSIPKIPAPETKS